MDSEDKKKKIIAASVEVFYRYGFRRVTMGMIADSVSISRPAVYKLFKNKEEVFEAAVALKTVKLFEDIKSQLPKYQTLEDKLVFICDKWCMAGYEMFAAAPEAAEIVDLSLPPIQTLYADFQNLLLSILSDKSIKKRKTKFKLQDHIKVFAFSIRSFKEVAKSKAELRQMVRIQVNHFVTTLIQ